MTVICVVVVLESDSSLSTAGIGISVETAQGVSMIMISVVVTLESNSDLSRAGTGI